MQHFLPSTLFLCCILIFSTVNRANSVLPSPPIYHSANDGILSSYAGEFDSSFRPVDGLGGPRFGVYFVSDTAESNYTLAIGLGNPPRWVWHANRNNLVDDGATLTLRADGNLLLADSVGRAVWKTNTANKGVVGIKLLDNGNLVLHDAKDNLIWQSFDFPTDVILPGQPVRSGHKLESRISAESSRDGSYSLLVRPTRVSLYYTSQSTPKIMTPYYTFLETDSVNTFKELRFSVQDADDHYSKLTLDYQLLDVGVGPSHMLAETKYNSTLSFLRLDYDGNLRVYTYYDKLSAGVWTTEFTLFTRENMRSGLKETECQLPERCGNLGVCSENQCVGCPAPAVLLGWNKDCTYSKFTECSDGEDALFYLVEGVEHFSIKYSKGEGPMKELECELKCRKDCKCMGYFYHQESSRCWIAYDIMTLTLSGNSSHIAHLKSSS